MNSLIEREISLCTMEELKEKNMKLEEKSCSLHLEIFGDVGEIRSKIKDQEHVLQEKEGPVTSQVQPYKPIEENVIDLTT